jgi:hypothetical protein
MTSPPNEAVGPAVRRAGTTAVAFLTALVMVACSTGSDTSDPDSRATLPRPPSPTAPAASTMPAPPTTAGPTTLAPTAPPSTVPPATAPASCPAWRDPEVTGRLDPALRETSGLVASRLTPGVLWAHNDSGNTPTLFALDEQGGVLAELDLDVAFLDWEDMATGPGPGGRPYLWVADTGDNLGLRPRVTIYRVPEPDVDVAPAEEPRPLAVPVGLERITVRYPDGPHDVEALLVDPVTGDAFLVGKEADRQGSVPVYRLAADRLHDGADVTAEPIGRIQGRVTRGNGPTAGDVSADGTLVLVSNGREGFLWLRPPSEPLASLFARQSEAPCRLDPGGGEAAAFSPDGNRLWAVNEGEGARLRRFDRVP